MSKDSRIQAFAEKKFYLEQLSPQDAVFYRRAWEFLDQKGGEASLADLYRLGVEIFNNGIINRVKVIYDPDIVATKPNHPQKEDWIKFTNSSLRDLTDDQYISVAAIHLFFMFAGEENVLVEKNGTFYQPLAVQLFGQQLWWLFHLVSPQLNSKYRKLIVSQIRPDRRDCTSFLHQTGEGFAIDFWQTWVLVFGTYRGCFTKWYERKIGPEGSPQSFRATANFLEVPVNEVTPEMERTFIGKSATYMLMMATISTEENTGISEDLGMNPTSLVFMAIARDIENFRKDEM